MEMKKERLSRPSASVVAEDDKNLVRKSILLSIGMQVGVEVPREDPAKFYSDVIGVLPEATGTCVANALGQLYPDERFAPHRLFKFMNDDQVLEEGLCGEKPYDRDVLPGDTASKDLEIMLSFYGVAMVKRIYDGIDRDADRQSAEILREIRKRTKPTN